MNGPTDAQIATLTQTAEFLRQQGMTVALILIASALGGACMVGLVLLQWRSGGRGVLPAWLAILFGAVAATAGFLLYGAAGRIITIEIAAPRVWHNTEYEALADSVKATLGLASGLGVLGITAGALYLLLGGGVFLRNRLAARRKEEADAAHQTAASADRNG